MKWSSFDDGVRGRVWFRGFFEIGLISFLFKFELMLGIESLQFLNLFIVVRVL